MTQTNELHVVLGAGPLGRAVMNELVRRGRRVRVVNRSGTMKAAPPGVEVAAGDAYDAGRMRDLTRGAAALYQCTQPPYTEWPLKFPALMESILEGTARSGAKLIVGDNLYCYGDTGGRPIGEDLPYTAHGRKGKVRAQVAAAALAAHQAGRVQVAIGRGSDFFGPHVRNAMMGERAFGPALQGRPAQLVGNVDLPHTQTYIEDFGRALVILGEREEALGQAWHVPNDQPAISSRQFLRLVYDEIGLPLKVSSANRLMLTLAAPVLPMAREILEMMYEFEKPYVVESGRFERTFGMKATPIAEAVKRTVAWYRAQNARQPVNGDSIALQP
jgi:nucleoside-diphosphate-sugar epimerase